MIGEPEMAHGDDGSGAAPDTISDTDRRPLPGRRPWAWAAAAVVLTSAVWAGALRATGYGRAHDPDLHGYRVTGTLCAADTFAGLLDALDAHDTGGPGPVVITRSSALDQGDCWLSATGGPGATEDFTLGVSVELHKKTDPAAEFDAVRHVTVPASEHSVAAVLSTDDDDVPATHPGGLGDRANLTSTTYRQKLAVRYGGAVLTLTLSATTRGQDPGGNSGVQDSRPADTSGFADDLVPAMRHLMSALARPANGG